MTQNSEHPEEQQSPRRQPACKLDQLPDEIKADFNKLILQNYGAKLVKKSLLARHSGKSDLLNASFGAFNSYIRRHKPELLKADEIQSLLIDSAKTDIVDLEEATETMFSGSPSEIKRKALTRLFKRCQARLELIEQHRKMHGIDPRFESIIVQYLKEERTIFDKLEGMQQEVKKEDADQFYEWMKSFTYCLLTLMRQTHDEIHGKEKLDEFYQSLEPKFQQALAKLLSNGGKWQYGPTLPDFSTGEQL